MIKNYLLVAFRNLKRNKAFSLINIGGLALGLAACWMISLYVANELSYDKWHANANRIYRVVQYAKWSGGQSNIAVTPAPMAIPFKNDFPEVVNTLRIDGEGGGTITYNDQHIDANDMIAADSSYFSFFDHHFITGNPQTALQAPGSIVLTATLARKIFGDASAAQDKLVTINGSNAIKVTAVIEDVPANSQLQFSGIRSVSSADWGNNWFNSSVYTYLLLKDKASLPAMQSRLPAFVNKYLKVNIGEGVQYSMQLQPLTSIHLNSHLDYDFGTNGNALYVTIFSLVAVLILLIASINYMNLATARATLRIKEIGVRKVSGSGRGQLMLMFLTESVFLTFIAAAIAIGLVNLCLPMFEQFTGKTIAIWHFGVLKSILFLLGFSLVAGCLSGIYPALYLSGFKLIPSLKGVMGSRQGNLLFRQSLVVFQFVITISMIAGSFIIWQQLQFVSKTDLGFNRDQLITFHLKGELRPQIDAIRSRLLQNPLIENVATASNPIGDNNIGGTKYTTEAADGMVPHSNKANTLQVDEHFVPAMQIKLVAGRNFSPGMLTDKDQAILINETLARDAGWKDPVGKKLFIGEDSLHQPRGYTIIGVVRDFNIYSLQHKIDPLVLSMPPQVKDKDNMYVRINRQNIKAGLQFTAAVFRQFDAASDFEYTFVDEHFARQYAAEKMQGDLLLTFTLLAIAIACLGLFGLVTFTAEQRRKEIGVRKVLGSSVRSIVFLLARDLVKLVLVAVLIASPLAWIAMQQWLQNFAYHVPVQWWVFIGAGLLAVIIAFLTVSVKSIKAARANPVKSLRTE